MAVLIERFRQHRRNLWGLLAFDLMPMQHEYRLAILENGNRGGRRSIFGQQFADALESISPDQETHIHLRDLDYVDDACLEALTNWQQQRTQKGSVAVIEWDDAMRLYRDKNPLGSYQRSDVVVSGPSH